jgi:LPS export ABC transporter protein LptC
VIGYLSSMSRETVVAWRKVFILLMLTGGSTLLAWRWGTRFQSASTSSFVSSLVAHYVVEGVQAELYEEPDEASPNDRASRSMHLEAKRIEALDEAGEHWLITSPVMTGAQLDGKHLRVEGPTARWDHSNREGYFPSTVEAVLDQAGHPSTHLYASQLKWSARTHHITTSRPFVLVYGQQVVHAVGLDWALDSGVVQLGSNVHARLTKGD